MTKPVVSPGEETFFFRMRKLFERFSKYSLTINFQKCKFGVTSTVLTTSATTLTLVELHPCVKNQPKFRTFQNQVIRANRDVLSSMIAFYKNLFRNVPRW